MKFEDGSVLDANDFARMLSIVKQRAKEGKPKPVELVADGVTIKVKGYDVKGGKGPEYANFIESKHKGWTMRVWKFAKDQMFGCNYYLGEDIRYFECGTSGLDENQIFAHVTQLINQIQGA